MIKQISSFFLIFTWKWRKLKQVSFYYSRMSDYDILSIFNNNKNNFWIDRNENLWNSNTNNSVLLSGRAIGKKISISQFIKRDTTIAIIN